MSSSWLRRASALLVTVGLAPIAAAAPWSPASASSVTSAVFSGGAGTVSVGGTLYAKQGAALTLTVVTSSDTKCVDVTGATTLPRQTSSTAKSNWTFTLSAAAGDGVQAFTVAASPNFNTNQGNGGQCTGQTNSAQASYTLDNTGPVVTPALSPAANAAGWNNGDVTVSWTATDTGSGVAAPQPFRIDAVSANGVSTVTAPAQSDRVGNTGAAPAAVTVRIDKTTPTIAGSRAPAANAAGWNNGDVTISFSCDDNFSGVKSCSAPTVLSSSAANQSVTGTAVDTADNSKTATVSGVNIDKVAPMLSGAPTTTPNAAGWYQNNVVVRWTASDVLSGLAGPVPSDTTLSSEGTAVTASASVSDQAGNATNASVAVKIDKTAPTATANRTPAPNGAGWNNTKVTVSFTCDDVGLQASPSGIKFCPSPIELSSDGANQSASGASIDNADNISATASIAGINIDRTAPTLTGAFAPGWHNSDVLVTWSCTDPLSGVASAPANTTVSGEGANLSASATCTDKAENTVGATAGPIKIDRTAPLTGVKGGSNNWTNGTVTLTLSPSDNLSGVASTQYSVDGGPITSGTSIALSTEGDHTITFSSTDVAGNIEALKTVHVRIDLTAPTIGHSFTPDSYTDGAWSNGDVTVTFDCADQGGSGLASCIGSRIVSQESTSQPIVGTATDNAGNSASDTALVSIDKTAPTITADVDRPANSNGWYNDDVTVSYTASDALSGIVTKSDDKVLDEGPNQSATGTATDAAGNSASAGVTGINIDKTGPILTASFPAGWNADDVTVEWTCVDPLSGPAGQPADSILDGEGADLSATANCSDLAGNSTTKTVSGIKIDRTPPATSASVPSVPVSGWYTAAVEVTLNRQDNLSGIANTYFRIDGGALQTYSGPFAVTGDGTHSISFWSVDDAGNVESTQSRTVKLDTAPPALSGTPTTVPNGDGWYSDDVTVHWTCSDVTSGIDGSCPADSTVAGEGDLLSASASVSDLAGNTTSTTVGGIRIDRTTPTTLSAVPAVPASGWYTAAVEVTLDPDDNLSGIATTYYQVDGGAAQTYSAPISVTGDGQHSVTFWSIDKAGNVESVGAPLKFQIDATKPKTTVINPISPDSGWFVTSGIPFAFDATDATAGVAATYYTIDGGDRQTYGEPFEEDLSTGIHTVNYWSVDLAGNAETTKELIVNVDTTAPTIIGSVNPSANEFGWNNGPVEVTFKCDDVGSGLRTGVAGCAGDTVLVNAGDNQSVKGDAVDVAGNKAQTTVEGINIDLTKPTLMGVATTDPNSGWYKSDVTVTWVGDDALSGLDPATQPPNSTITGEGVNLGAGPVVIKDKAGNTSDPAMITGINIDLTAPVINGGATTQPNAAGWYNGEVTIDFKCTDNLSGVASCPTSEVIKGDGVNQGVTSDTASDVAGNVTAGKTVDGINIDSTAPTSQSNNQCSATNGWCTGSTANVVLTASDQVGLSGVKEIHYRIDGGAEQVAAGSSKTVSVSLDGSGAGTVQYWAVDNAGNVEPANAVALKWDNIAPAVSHSLSPAPNADEWNNTTVTVTFTAKDDDKGSGVASVSAPVTVSAETAGELVTGTAKDTAGNVGTDSVTVKLDKTAPTINGAITSGNLTASGWYNTAVKVTFSCSDALSGVATCADPVNLTGNGINGASGTAHDHAGNFASASVNGIKIDQEKPTLTTAGVNVQGATYVVGAVPTATCTATDSFSGMASCTVVVTGGNANGVGLFTYTATATDKAGNATAITGSFTVRYRFDGFLQPINDTAHQVGVSTSVFKAGSTVPVKFQLKNAAGQVVQAVTAPMWLTPAKGSSMSAPVDESVYTFAADSGTTYKYDTGQYIYNWSTKGVVAGSYYRIGVKLDDGQTYYVNIGLR